MPILGHDKPHETPGASTWTKQEEAKLIDLLAKGMSGTEIAKILGKTRMAVLGKKHRMKLKSAVNKGNRPKKTQAPKLGAIPGAGQCAWHDDEYGWCCAPTQPGSAYCQGHYERSIQTPQPELDVDFLLYLARRS